MIQEEADGFQEKLNALSMYGCEDVHIGDALHYPLNWYNASKIGTLKSIVKIFIIIPIFIYYEYELKGTPNTVALLSKVYRKRQEHCNNFKEVVQLINNALIMKTSKAKLNFAGLKHLNNVFIWNRQLKNVVKSFQLRVYLIEHIFQMFSDYERLEQEITKNHLNIFNIVVYCDFQFIDSYFVQKFKSNGRKTVTLQHGIMTDKFYGLQHTISDYFLAQSDLMKHYAVLAGLDENKVFVVGAPQNIGFTGQYEFKWKHNRIIGLIGGGNIEVDTEMINMLKKFGNLYGYKIYIKFHPVFGKKHFSQEILKDIDKMYETEIDVQGFHDMVDFAVDHGSTTFSEYMVYGKMAFTYQYRNDVVYARDTNIKLGFKNYDEMEKLFLMYENEDEELLKQLEYNKSYLGTKEPPSILYKRFFEEYL